MTITDFAEKYIAARDISKDYCHRLRTSAKRLQVFTGHTETAAIFQEDQINRFLASFTDVSPFTVRSIRADVLTLWNGAADCDLATYPVARRIRRPKCPQLTVECFTIEEVRAILDRVAYMDPRPLSNGVDRAAYWNAVIRLAWDSGLRRGDCWKFRKSWLRPDRTARVVQQKTQQAVTIKLHPSTVEALELIPFDLACHWPGAISNSNRFSKQFKSLVRQAGVGRGTFKFLRRSSGSYCDLAQPGSGGKHLGHSDPRMFDAHYNGRLGGHVGPMPPDLGSADAEPVAAPTTGDAGEWASWL